MKIDIHHATRLHQAQQYQDAEQLYLLLLKQNNNSNIHYLLGLLYSQTKEFEKAIQQLEQAFSSHKANPDLYNALAMCYQKTKKNTVAERLINIAISLNPANKHYYNRKSKILISANKLEQSLNNSLTCLSQHPQFIPAYQTYAIACDKLHRPGKRLHIMKKAWKQLPNNPVIAFELAEAYLNTGKYEKAAPLFLALEKHNFKRMACLNNLGNIERSYGDLSIAQNLYEEAEKLSPENPIIQWNLSLLSLLNENYTDGWNKYDYRLKLKKTSTALPLIPTWQGQDLTNKSVIILPEQGLGDEILFSSSFSQIITNAKKTVLLCEPRLKPIFEQSFPLAEIIEKNDNKYLDITYDYQIYAGSILQHTKNSHITRQYLKPTKKIQLNKSTLHIGFSWKGGTTYSDIKKRSIQLKYWRNLLNNKNYHFHCLQHNISSNEKKILNDYAPNITFLNSKKDGINDLINIIASLDLIISVTNTNVHIAGALGVKTWCLTPKNPDWPWGMNKNQCQWYDSVEMIRKTDNAWHSVLIEIEKKLGEFKRYK